MVDTINAMTNAEREPGNTATNQLDSTHALAGQAAAGCVGIAAAEDHPIAALPAQIVLQGLGLTGSRDATVAPEITAVGSSIRSNPDSAAVTMSSRIADQAVEGLLALTGRSNTRENDTGEVAVQGNETSHALQRSWSQATFASDGNPVESRNAFATPAPVPLVGTANIATVDTPDSAAATIGNSNSLKSLAGLATLAPTPRPIGAIFLHYLHFVYGDTYHRRHPRLGQDVFCDTPVMPTTTRACELWFAPYLSGAEWDALVAYLSVLAGCLGASVPGIKRQARQTGEFAAVITGTPEVACGLQKLARVVHEELAHRVWLWGADPVLSPKERAALVPLLAQGQLHSTDRSSMAK